MTWQEAVVVTVCKPVGLKKVKRHSSCHLPAASLAHQVTLPGTGWHQLIGLSVRMTSWSSVGFRHSSKATWIFSHICLSQCQHMEKHNQASGIKAARAHFNGAILDECTVVTDTQAGSLWMIIVGSLWSTWATIAWTATTVHLSTPEGKS